MGTKRYMRNFAALGVTAALMVAFALLALPREAFAIVNQTVLCQGEITSSGVLTGAVDAAPPTGINFSIGNVTVQKANFGLRHDEHYRYAGDSGSVRQPAAWPRASPP